MVSGANRHKQKCARAHTHTHKQQSCVMFKIRAPLRATPHNVAFVNMEQTTEPNTTESLTFHISTFIVLAPCVVLHKQAVSESPAATLRP